MKKALIVICGATASGKSGLALAIAQHLSTQIISADSRQIYREFNIGTAKPTLCEREQVPHSLIDICDPTETLTLAQYQQQAQTLIDHPSLFSAVPPLLVGGTGLYIKSIVRGLKIPRVAPQSELRSQLQSLGQSYCHRLLTQIDPMAVSQIHANDTIRTIRALEVFYVTGIPISQQQGEVPPPYPILNLGLDCDRASLERRITRRTHAMVEAGLVKEVAYLAQKYGFNLPLLQTLGYGEIKAHLLGEMSLDEAIAQIILHTGQLAKRQRTWFRADPTIEWFDGDNPQLLDKIRVRIQNFMADL